MTSEELAELRSFAASGDRDARIEMDCGKLIDLIDDRDGLLRMLEVAHDAALRHSKHRPIVAAYSEALRDALAEIAALRARPAFDAGERSRIREAIEFLSNHLAEEDETYRSIMRKLERME